VDVISIDEARALVSNQALWPRVRDFLWNFAPQIHESWLEGLCGHETLDARREDGSSIVSSLSSSWRIKKSILDSLGVAPCFHTFPKDDGSRILLLDGATIESIAKWLGALAYADALRRVTSGATVRELKAALPGVYPEVFGYTAYFGKLKVEKVEVEKVTPQSIMDIGVACLFSFVSHLPQPLLQRLTLKLPRTLQPGNLETSELLNFSTSQPLNRQLLLKLLKLRFPEAHSLCCL
jgi:hypothetical protein